MDLSDAIETTHPELVIHQMPLTEFRSITTGELVPMQRRTVWAVTHAPSMRIVVSGLLTLDLAKKAVWMLTAADLTFAPDDPSCLEVAAFQAAASLMADTFFEIVTLKERQCPTHD